jgi:hypothetical protein
VHQKNLPVHVLTHNFIASLHNVPNNLCFFAACVIAFGARREGYTAKANELFVSFCRAEKSKAEVEALIRNYKGLIMLVKLMRSKNKNKNSRTQ